MGSYESKPRNKKITYEKRISKLGNDFPKNKFIKARSSSTIARRIHEMKKVGTYLNGKNIDFISKNGLCKVCFIVINTYKRQNFYLGVGPLNDATIFASSLNRKGYRIYFLHNPTRNEFLTYLKYFVQNTQTALTIFYSGRTTALQYEETNIFDKNEENKKNKFVKAMVFEQGYVIDLDIGNILNNFKLKQLKTVFISDFCHNGPIWDFDSPICKIQNLPDRIISISVDINDDISDYDKILMTNDGIFTICLLKISKEFPNLTPIQLKEKISPLLNKYGLSIVYHITSNDLENEQIFL